MFKAPMNTTLNNCSYYSYSLVVSNVTTLDGHNVSCGGENKDGTLNVSNPLHLSLKSGELLL